jgi:diguanylate cyclase (GGDEF)-like protein
MGLAGNVVLDLYSIAILLVICYHATKRHQRESAQHRLYMLILWVAVSLLFIDVSGRFDGRPDTVYPLVNRVGNFLLFLLSPILPSLWLLYSHLQVFGDKPWPKSLLHPLIAANAANALFTLLTPHTGWYYYIDASNIYHRGPLFLVSFGFTAIQLLAAFAMIIINRKRIDQRHFFSLMFFAVPPCLGIMLQVLIYGTSLILSGVTVSLLVVFLNVQNKSIHTDYLTGVSNRKRLESYLDERIATSTADRTFSAILIDLDNFKAINDTFGHDMGDKALQISAELLKSCVRSDDLIARFGGDEFCVVLRTGDRSDLDAIIQRINNCVAKYNATSAQPYKLGFTMGYDVYDHRTHMKAEEFQKRIDTLMYENKRRGLTAGE